MSQGQTRQSDAWDELAEHRDVLEEIVDEGLAFAPQARRLLDELDRRGR